MNANPIIIVGAPRSGTSLLQKLLRECPGHASVPREAQHIWGPHVHPSVSGWAGETVPDAVLEDEQLIASIREEFAQSAVAAKTWRRMEKSPLGRSAWLKQIARLFPRQAVEALALGGRASDEVRLVEKSVHAGLWLALVDAVFPNARYLHIVRDPRKSIPSIMTGWLEPSRFVSFEVPEELNIGGTSGTSHEWCFPLPAGWREYRQADLQTIATFQWIAINTAILDFFASNRSERCLVVRLEELIKKPGDSLRTIRRHAGIKENEYFSEFEDSLPVVNKGKKRAAPVSVDEQRMQDRVSAIAARFGY